MINIVNKFFLLAVCFFYALLRGKADKKTVNPGKILIVQMASMGDMVCTTPMFRAIRKKFPNTYIVVMGKKMNEQTLAFNPDINEYIVYGDFIDTFKKIRQSNFEFACITAPNFRVLVLLFLAGISAIAVPEVVNGFSPYQTKAYGYLSNLVMKVKHRMGSYAPAEYLKLLEPIGINTADTKKYLYFSSEAKGIVDKFMADNSMGSRGELIIGISPSAGNKIKCWQASKFARFADIIYADFKAKIVILGGPGDKKESEEMLNFLGFQTKVINTVGLFSIDELKSLISRLDMVISVDSGPIYIAEAFGVPTVDIIGPIDENEQPPISSLHRIVVADRKNPELYVMNARIYNKNEARRQVESITVEMVMAVFRQLLKQ